ncbi:TPA: tRNA-intron lyase [Candidatus Woesearchaeota archaeon]|nr:tRNA-intron lyase [Candidatus Woesearchaeota archaeon]
MAKKLPVSKPSSLKQDIITPVVMPASKTDEMCIASNNNRLGSDRTGNDRLGNPRQMIVGRLVGQRVILDSSDPARDLYSQSRYGTVVSGGRVQLSLLEGLFLLEKEKIVVKDGRSRTLSHDALLAAGKRGDKSASVKYAVFRDLRARGYIVKTALKFGADLRVYDRGVKPGEDHAKWIVYPVHESAHMTWYDFSAKNRVAHSTKKRLLIGVVDDEDDVTYYEVKWMRP